MAELSRYMLIFILAAAAWNPVAAQSDELNRSVTVERDFQPTIQSAGKVATKPAVVETDIEPAPVEYSDYTADVTPGTSFNPLLSQPTRFNAGRPYNGYIRGAVGHPNTLFDFGYHLDDHRQSILDVYAHHKAQWGLKALSRTKIGLNFTHQYEKCNLYFGVNGGNIYYHKYGHFYDYSLVNPGAWIKDKTAYPEPRTMGPTDKTNLWTAEAYLGVKANAKQDVQYRVQTGYMLFAKPGAVAEHQIRTHADFDWHREAHHVGAVLYVQNNFLQLGSLAADIPDSLYNSRHNIRFEPYYAYDGKRVQLHLGLNLDMNIGRGKNSLSGIQNLTFAPSPHLHLEAQIAKQWMTLYLDAKGNHGTGSLQSFMENNRYRLIHPGIISHHPSPYTPIDAELGFHIRPYKDLLIELHGGYAYMLDQMTLIATTDSANYKHVNIPLRAGDFSYIYSDYGRGMIGAQINYHFQDIVRVHVYTDYFFWTAFHHETNAYGYKNPSEALTATLNDSVRHVYDRIKWRLGLRIDGKIDKHWSLYSDNYFAGGRTALATDGEHKLQPTIQLDLGVQYDMWVGKAKASNNRHKADKGPANSTLPLAPEPQPNLSLFFQLNNFINRKNDIYYGYQSQGINFLMGLTFRF